MAYDIYDPLESNLVKKALGVTLTLEPLEGREGLGPISGGKRVSDAL